MEKLSFEFTEIHINKENFTVSFVNQSESYSPALYLYIGDIDIIKTVYKYTEFFTTMSLHCFDIILKSRLHCIFYSKKMPVSSIELKIEEIISLFFILKEKELNK